MKLHGSNLKPVSCNLCGSTENELLFWAPEFLFNSKPRNKRRQFAILKCKKCDLVFTDLRQINKNQGFAFRTELVSTGLGDKIEHLVYSFYYNFPRKIPKTKPGRVLDVGCGIGRYLKVLKENNWDVYGVDIDPLACRLAKEKFNLNIFNGELAKASFPPEYFDLITFWQSLEHISDPINTLKEAHRILRKNGLLVIAAPNFASFESKIFKENYAFLGAPFHLYHFTPKTLGGMLKRTGFIPKKEAYDFLTPSSLTWSLLGLFENQLNRGIDILLKKLASLLMFPLFLPINFILAKSKRGAFMAVYARKQHYD